MIMPVMGASTMPPICQPAHAMPSDKPKWRENQRAQVTGIEAAKRIFPNPIAPRSKYICGSAETLAKRMTQMASILMPTANMRVTPKRRIA